MCKNREPPVSSATRMATRPENGMARRDGPIVICVINMKGGVGKSTISALLARRAFARRGLDVLTVDLDPQANLSQGLMHLRYAAFLQQQRPSIVEIFNGFVPPGPGHAAPQAIGPTTALETIARDGARTLQLIPSRFDFSDNLLGAVRPNARNLAAHLAGNFAHKDLVLIDCAPTESVFTTAAYHASGKVLVPVKPEFFATIGFPLLQQSLTAFRNANRGHKLDVAGIVINNAFYDGGNDGGPEKATAMSEITTEAARNGWPIYRQEMYHSRGYPKIMRGVETYPGNAQYFFILADEIFQSVGL